ncbi:MAG: hypothetical protein ACI9U2_001439 [Bradymonadia bacterium]
MKARRSVIAPLAAVARFMRGLWRVIPFSLAGLLTTAFAAWVWVEYGRDRADFVIQSAALVMLAVVAASVLVTAIAGIVLFASVRKAARQHVEGDMDAGTELRTGMRMLSFRWWPMVKVHLRWVDPTAARVTLVQVEGRADERVVIDERGRFSMVEREFALRDIFGLASVGFTLRTTANLRVAPAPCRASLAIALRHASGEGYAHPAGKVEGDRIEMRRYAPGDPVRMILWRVYARSRRLLVRVPERAIAPQPSAVAYFVAGDADEPTASAARLFVEQGLLGADFRFSADGVSEPATDEGQAIEHIIDSAQHRETGGEGLPDLLRRHDRSELGNCVFFVPGEDGPWVDQVIAISQSLPAPPTLVLAVDGTLDLQPKGRVRRWFVTDPNAQQSGLSHLPALYDRLASLGGPVHVVHRPTGEAIAPLQIDRMRA